MYEDIQGWNNRAKDITNQKFGKLTAIRPLRKDESNNWIWLCQCDCDNTYEARLKDLTSNHVISCGCYKITQSPSNMENARDILDGTYVQLLTQKTRSDNKTGIKGVSFCKKRNKYVAQIGFKGKVYGLGRYNDIQDAIEARKIAEQKLFGEFLEWYNSEYKRSDKID